MAMKNNGGCDVFNQPVTYDSDKDTRKRFIVAGMPWWTRGMANLFLVPIFSFLDGLVLYTIFAACFVQNVFMSIVMAFGVAVVLNVLPLVIARFVHEAIHKTSKNSVMLAAIFISGFLLIYGGTVYLRFAYSDMYGEEKQEMVLQNTVSNDNEIVSETPTQNNSKKGRAVVVLLSISPLITSLLGFGIAFVSDDEIRKKVEELEIQRTEIDEKLIDIKASIIQMESMMDELVAKDLILDKESMDTAIDEIIARGDILKAYARTYLAEYIKNASAISKLSQDMIVNNDEVRGTTSDCEMEEPVSNMRLMSNGIA